VIPIADPADARLEDYRNIPDAELIERRGIFVAEGRLVVARLLADGRFTTRSLMVTETALHALLALPALPALLALPALPVYVVPAWMMNAITGFNIHRGCLAIGERRPLPSWRALAAASRRLVVVERVANADNVGAIFRNAAALGADGVLLEATCTDPLYRKAIRTSMGAALRVPYARIEPWPAALRELREAGWSLVALTPSAPQTLETVDVDAGSTGPGRRPAQLALVLGHEGDGLSAEALDACERRARIPMAAGADSLNVATAAAIALYHFRD
jgi:tRNA G18 (ribose-2'-O)-methylase SpoU